MERNSPPEISARPKTWAEVIGHRSIVQSIQNSLKDNYQAFLLHGPNGTGKTTIARLIGAHLNCTSVLKPCGTCPSCELVVQCIHPDVLEKDAASNRGIDNIREIISRTNISPHFQAKVFILDEAHMMTTEAFNALLKTLEEPPEDVYFILCTTEISKIPKTIISRCLSYKLQPLNKDELKEILHNSFNTLDLEFTERAIENSGGSVRKCLKEYQLYNSGLSLEVSISGETVINNLLNNQGWKHLGVKINHIEFIKELLDELHKRLLKNPLKPLVIKCNKVCLSYIDAINKLPQEASVLTDMCIAELQNKIIEAKK